MTFTDLDVLEAHALRLDDPQARALVDAWRRAAGELAGYIARRRGDEEGALDLVDASTLAAIFVEASRVS